MKPNLIKIECLNNGEEGLMGLQHIMMNFMLSELKEKKNVKFSMRPKKVDENGTSMFEYYENDELICCIKTEDDQFYFLESYISVDKLFLKTMVL